MCCLAKYKHEWQVLELGHNSGIHEVLGSRVIKPPGLIS